MWLTSNHINFRMILGKITPRYLKKVFEITLALLGLISNIFLKPRVDFSQITLQNMYNIIFKEKTQWFSFQNSRIPEEYFYF